MDNFQHIYKGFPAHDYVLQARRAGPGHAVEDHGFGEFSLAGIQNEAARLTLKHVAISPAINDPE